MMRLKTGKAAGSEPASTSPTAHIERQPRRAAALPSINDTRIIDGKTS